MLGAFPEKYSQDANLFMEEDLCCIRGAIAKSVDASTLGGFALPRDIHAVPALTHECVTENIKKTNSPNLKTIDSKQILI